MSSLNGNIFNGKIAQLLKIANREENIPHMINYVRASQVTKENNEEEPVR